MRGRGWRAGARGVGLTDTRPTVWPVAQNEYSGTISQPPRERDVLMQYAGGVRNRAASVGG